MLYSFILLLEGKAYKVFSESSKLELTEKFPANNFASSDAKENTSGPLNKDSIYSKLTFVENNISNSQKAKRVKYLGSDILFCFISARKYVAPN